MTNKELAQRTREILTERGWQPGPGDAESPLCLLQAVGEALGAWPMSIYFDRVNEFARALGFENRLKVIPWNDTQTSVEAIFERLEMVA